MSWKANPTKEEMIERFGQTYGLPLFGQNNENSYPDNYTLPNWIWDGTGIKAEVYRQMQKKFAEDAFMYLRALMQLGGSATDHEVKDLLKWDLHIVSARRNNLKKLGVVESYTGKKKIGPHGVANTIWFVNYKNLRTLLNTPE